MLVAEAAVGTGDDEAFARDLVTGRLVSVAYIAEEAFFVKAVLVDRDVDVEDTQLLILLQLHDFVHPRRRDDDVHGEGVVLALLE